MNTTIDCLHAAVGAMRANHCPLAANRVLIEVVPVVERLAASLAEIRMILPAVDPLRIEAEAALKQYREGIL